jgi:hypothetical protein
MLRLSACCCFGGSSTDSLSLSSTASSNGWFCTGRDCVVAIRQGGKRCAKREQHVASAQAVLPAWLPIRARRVSSKKEAAQGGGVNANLCFAWRAVIAGRVLVTKLKVLLLSRVSSASPVCTIIRLLVAAYYRVRDKRMAEMMRGRRATHQQTGTFEPFGTCKPFVP